MTSWEAGSSRDLTASAPVPIHSAAGCSARHNSLKREAKCSEKTSRSREVIIMRERCTDWTSTSVHQKTRALESWHWHHDPTAAASDCCR